MPYHITGTKVPFHELHNVEQKVPGNKCHDCKAGPTIDLYQHGLVFGHPLASDGLVVWSGWKSALLELAQLLYTVAVRFVALIDHCRCYAAVLDL